MAVELVGPRLACPGKRPHTGANMGKMSQSIVQDSTMEA